MRNLPRFEGRKTEEKPKISTDIDNIQIQPKIENSIPKLENENSSIDNAPKDLFGKIKQLFNIDKLPSKTTINNITYNTKNVNNSSNSDGTIPNKSIINNSKNLIDQNKKISIMNSYMGKNPTMVRSEKLFGNNSPRIEKNINSIQYSLNSSENIWKNEYNKVNLESKNTNNKYDVSTNMDENYANNKYDVSTNMDENYANNKYDVSTNINDNNSASNKNISILNNTKNNENVFNTSNIENGKQYYKTSVERKPHFYENKKIKYVFSPKHEKSFISFAEGGMLQQTAQNSYIVSQPTPIAMAGDKTSGAAENIRVTAADGPNSIEAASKATSQANTEKTNVNKQEQRTEEITGGEIQFEGGNSSSITNNISNNITTKQMTTFEKVAIETAFLPNWRRIFG